MKWFFRIFLSALFFTVGIWLAGTKAFSQANHVSSTHQSVFEAQSSVSLNSSLKFLGLYHYEQDTKLLAAEFEEDTEPVTGKKQTAKVSTAIYFANVCNLVFNQPALYSSLLPGKLPAALKPNNIYLSLQVFRL